MKDKIGRLANLGNHDGLSKNEEKLVKLLNYICLTWYAILVVLSITDYFIEEKYVEVLTGYVLQFLFLILVQYLQSKHKYTAGRIIFVSISWIQFLIFSTWIIPGRLIEFFHLLVPLFSLLFFSKNGYHFFYLTLAFVGFFIPMNLHDLYPVDMFVDPTIVFVLFTAVFLLFSYFKRLNVANEGMLEEQNSMVVKDKVVIEQQKQELEKLHDFQNQFFVNVAHEIRTPLTIVKGNTSKIKRDMGNQDDEVMNAVLTVENQTLKIQHIVDNILDLTRMDSNTFELRNDELSLSAFASKIALSFHSNFQNKYIDFQLLDYTNRKVKLWADAVYLEGTLNNIIFNALKYTDEGGFVHVIIDSEGEEVILRVKDSGHGISEDDQGKIFNRFYQADNSVNRSGGSGIGLAFSKEVIAKHGGSLSVESKLGEGSTFLIRLPIHGYAEDAFLAEPILEKAVVQSAPQVESNLNDITILLVEDHTEMRTYIRSVLAGFTVIEATNGEEALDLLAEHEVQYIITDYMMPKMNGRELVEQVKNKGIDLPILMLTARTDSEARLEMLRLGIDDYVTKPFEEEELLVRINNSLRNFSSREQFITQEAVKPEETKDTEFMQQLKSYIEEHCTDHQFGVPEISDHFAMSVSSLYRKVKSLTGLATKAVITEVRLQKAREIMGQNSALSVRDVATRVGFVNYTHFTKLYEDRFGKL